ncbi:MAG: Gfo/Idh/MocA family oxidoreductase [Verrucomicrobia bacterium]|nr:Gfo/Idh/MocA family oxidoreductase [Verrucomicrobiota bacterium]
MNAPSFPRDLALIGAGYWGKNLARNFRDLGALHTLCDSNASVLDTYGNDYAGIPKCTQVEEVMANPAIHKVAIAAPAALHYTLAKAALQAGKDVFVEKPLCLDEREAEELVALAASSGRILMVGHLLQYHPCVRKIQELLAGGDLGKLYYVTSNRLNLGKIRQEENALWSFAPHDISVILSLAGHRLPEQVQCVGEDYLSDGVADTTVTLLGFPGRVRAHVYVSWLNPFKEQKLTVVGSKGMVVFDDTQPWGQKLILHRDYLTWAGGQVPTPSKAKGEPVLVAETEPLRCECQHFLDCCRDRTAPRTDGAEGLRVLKVLRMAQESLEQQGRPLGDASENQSASRGRTGAPDRAVSTTVGAAAPAGVGMQPDYYVHPTAVVDEGAVVGRGTKIWHFSHVMKGARIGERCVLGQNVNVDNGAILGNNVKVQNNVSVYTGVEIEDDVFLGPSCVLTNVTNPRSQVNRHSLYEKTRIRRGATVGANATIVCGITVGRYAFIAAGAVVTKDVPDYALMVGNPARQQGWMSRHGHRLKPGPDGFLTCPETGYRYQESDHGTLRCVDLSEDAPLPPEWSKGTRSYDEFKR